MEVQEREVRAGDIDLGDVRIILDEMDVVRSCRESV